MRALAGPRVGPRRVVVVRQREVAGAQARRGSAARRATSRSTGLPRRRSSRRRCRSPRSAPRRRPSARAPAGRGVRARARTAYRSARASSSPRRAGRRGPTGRRPTRTGRAGLPLQAGEVGVEARDGVADVVRLALLGCLPQRPDEVVVPVDERGRTEERGDLLSVLVSHRPDATQPPPTRRRPRRPPPGPRRCPARSSGWWRHRRPRAHPSAGAVAVDHTSVPPPFLVVSETTFDGCEDPPAFTGDDPIEVRRVRLETDIAVRGHVLSRVPDRRPPGLPVGGPLDPVSALVRDVVPSEIDVVWDLAVTCRTVATGGSTGVVAETTSEGGAAAPSSRRTSTR